MIFLSASVPTPKREYFDTENIFAIREAIVSFTKVCAEYSLPFYFGGHPAITPLIWKVAMHNTKKAIPLIKIYQSKIFGESIPKEVDDFKHVFFILLSDKKFQGYKIRADFICEVSPFSLDFCC